MEIKTYNSAQLNHLIRSDAYKRMPVVPISTQRAISHIHNPRAEKDDVLMIIAYEGEAMIGYLGVLADRIYTSKGEACKCGWLSCMWVNPLLRGKGIAKQLLATAFKAWDDHILVTEFTPEAKGLYDRSGGFNDLRVNHGLRCYMRFNLHEILPKKSERYTPYTGVLKWVDSIANLPIALRLSFFKFQSSFEQVKEIEDDISEYIASKQSIELERRDEADRHWILQYPWLIKSHATDESRKYHFSSVADRFENLLFVIRENSQIKAFLHLTIRDNHLRVPYAYFEKENLAEVVQQLYYIMNEYKLNMLTVFHPDIVAYLSSHSSPFLYRRPIRRKYIISKKLDEHFADKDKLMIQDGDADCAFT